MIFRRRPRCGFVWTHRRYARMAFSFAAGDWYDERNVCICKAGHAGDHESAVGRKKTQ